MPWSRLRSFCNQTQLRPFPKELIDWVTWHPITLFYNLGLFLFDNDEFESALPLAQAAAALAPDDEDIVHHYGATLSALRRNREALQVLKRATRLQPPCPSAWYDLGVVQERMQKYGQARRCFLKSLALAPNRGAAHYELACLDAREHNADAAFSHLEQAATNGCDYLSALDKDPNLRHLHSDPRWKPLVERIHAAVNPKPSAPAPAGAPKTYEVMVLARYNRMDEEGRSCVGGFPTLKAAIEYARRRTRDSVEKLRPRSKGPLDLKARWFAQGEDCVVVGGDYKGGDEIDFFIAHPAPPEERNWACLAPVLKHGCAASGTEPQPPTSL